MCLSHELGAQSAICAVRVELLPLKAAGGSSSLCNRREENVFYTKLRMSIFVRNLDGRSAAVVMARDSQSYLSEVCFEPSGKDELIAD